MGIGIPWWFQWVWSQQQIFWKLLPHFVVNAHFSMQLLTSLVTQMEKNLPAIQETWLWSLDWEDPLEKGMATHSSILAWNSPGTEEPGGLQSTGLQSRTQLRNWHKSSGDVRPRLICTVWGLHTNAILQFGKILSHCLLKFCSCSVLAPLSFWVLI